MNHQAGELNVETKEGGDSILTIKLPD